MINLTEGPIVFQQPFHHLEVSRILDREAAYQLRRSFPRNLNVTARKSGTDKTYVVSNRRILDADGTRNTKSACWNRFLDDVVSANYLAYLSEISGVSLKGSFVEVDVNAYTAGGYMSPHTDRPEKILSHIIYLAPHWKEDWGGGIFYFWTEWMAVLFVALCRNGRPLSFCPDQTVHGIRWRR